MIGRSKKHVVSYRHMRESTGSAKHFCEYYIYDCSYFPICLQVIYPLSYKRVISTSRMVVVIASIWVLSIAVELPQVTIWVLSIAVELPQVTIWVLSIAVELPQVTILLTKITAKKI